MMSQKEKKIICNQCGKEIKAVGEITSDFLEIKKTWGYFSDGKDGQIHRIHLCERCYDAWIAGFTRSVDIEEVTEFM